jgi:hypothetical protein
MECSNLMGQTNIRQASVLGLILPPLQLDVCILKTLNWGQKKENIKNLNSYIDPVRTQHEKLVKEKKRNKLKIKLNIDFSAILGPIFSVKRAMLFFCRSFCTIEINILEKTIWWNDLKNCIQVIDSDLHQMVHKSCKYIFHSIMSKIFSGIPLKCFWHYFILLFVNKLCSV